MIVGQLECSLNIHPSRFRLAGLSGLQSCWWPRPHTSTSVKIRCDCTWAILSAGRCRCHDKSLSTSRLSPSATETPSGVIYRCRNVRPISILPFISKLFENAINFKLSSHFENLFSPFLAAFRLGMGCQSTLLRLVEDWRKALCRSHSHGLDKGLWLPTSQPAYVNSVLMAFLIYHAV